MKPNVTNMRKKTKLSDNQDKSKKKKRHKNVTDIK